MKSILDEETRTEIINRIESLNEECLALWGKMNVGQMVKHCTLCEELYLGKMKFKRVFLGRIFGRFALKRLLRDERPIGKNAPTAPYLMVTDKVEDLEEKKQIWKALVKEYESYSADQFIHPFFGKLTRNELGRFVYKHCDHHLRQFGR